MKIYLCEVEYGRLEPREDDLQRYDFEFLVDMDDGIVARWQQAIREYDKAQDEMKATADKHLSRGH